MAKAKSTKTTSISLSVESLHISHPRVRAKDWCAPLAIRLLHGAAYKNGSVEMNDSWRKSDMTVVENSLGLAWNGLETDHDQCKNTYQEPVLTEFATLGLACILLTRHTDLRISEVTRRGEKVDYWIGDDAQRKQFVLEVGGLQNGNIDNLSNDKITQSVQNPWGRDGYVCVAVFGQLRSRLWYFLHRSGT